MAGPNSSNIKWLQMLIMTKPGFLGSVHRPFTNQSRKERGEGSSPLTWLCSALSLNCSVGNGKGPEYQAWAYVGEVAHKIHFEKCEEK